MMLELLTTRCDAMDVSFDRKAVRYMLEILKYYAKDKRHNDINRQYAMNMHDVFESLLKEYDDTFSQLQRLQGQLGDIRNNIKNIVDFINTGEVTQNEPQ